MKQYKVTVLVKKDLSRSKKREVRGWSLQIITTIVFFLSIASLVIILGLDDDHVKKFLVSEELCFPELPASSVCSNRSINLEDLIAPKDMLHWTNDEERLLLASMVPGISEYPRNHTPKVAFMFLSWGRLPLAPLWERFFKGHEGLYSIYLHTSPEFSEGPPESSVFHKRRIPSKVRWIHLCSSL
ncbi:hypothetical protein HS088_TW02G00927 [Tripterygium wilfordii]|uniref:Uncharacterized protein n=1 Tax=Tripterygium wilfordii TaxID=458696 RepID=A0A7J7DZY5_TRIWF|nr:uncharacterized protein LOC120012479 [Tripterygium wilfordii]KAF5751908.1 hypothetical protein HS088_TW02G00927 [Tripterygium wilfordii]